MKGGMWKVFSDSLPSILRHTAEAEEEEEEETGVCYHTAGVNYEVAGARRWWSQCVPNTEETRLNAIPDL